MIEINNICRTWGSFSLKNISFTVSQGEWFTILGPCGSGKTLLLETIAGLHWPDHGRVAINNLDVTDLTPERRKIALVYQQYSLFPHLSVRNNIGYGLRYTNLTSAQKAARIEQMLSTFEIGYLADRKTPAGLSGGESQKVALARALAVEPQVLLLDEPMSSFDPQTKKKTISVLQKVIKQYNIPVLHVTHDYTEATALADRIAIFRDGEVAQQGPVAEVFHKPVSPFVADFLGLENVLQASYDGHYQQPDGEKMVIRIGDLRLMSSAPPLTATTTLASSVPSKQRSDTPIMVSGAVAVCINPAAVSILPAEYTGREPVEAANRFTGQVTSLKDAGPTIQVEVMAGQTLLKSVQERTRFMGLGAGIGTMVTVEIPQAQIHLMAPDHQQHQLPTEEHL